MFLSLYFVVCIELLISKASLLNLFQNPSMTLFFPQRLLTTGIPVSAKVESLDVVIES